MPDHPEEFAEFVLVYFQRLRDKYGIVPDAFEVILEPENTERWRGPTIGRALVAATDRLKANGFTPEIVAPSNTSMPNAIEYFDEMIAVPGVLGRLGNFSYHRYGIERLADVRAIRERAERHRLKTSMLEKVDAGDRRAARGSRGRRRLVVAAVGGGGQEHEPGQRRLLRTRRRERHAASRDHDGEAHPPARAAVPARATWGGTGRNRLRPSRPRLPPPSLDAMVASPCSCGRGAKGGRVTLKGLPAGAYAMRFVSDAFEGRDLRPATVSAGGTLDVELTGPGLLAIHGAATP
jgi:hypothetical protein